MNVAVIIAGGSGQRMGQDIPKQFINVYDKPVLIYTLEGFQRHPQILPQVGLHLGYLSHACLHLLGSPHPQQPVRADLQKLRHIRQHGDVGKALAPLPLTHRLGRNPQTPGQLLLCHVLVLSTV